jgi:hypothetical protein
MGGRGGGGMGMGGPTSGAELGQAIAILLPAIVFVWFLIQLIVLQSAIRVRRSRGVE